MAGKSFCELPRIKITIYLHLASIADRGPW